MNENSARRKASIWVGAVFVLGIVLGGVLGYAFARHSVAAARAPMNEDGKRAHRVEQLSRELNLNETQKQQLSAILSQVDSEIRAVRKEHIDPLREKGREQIRAILEPEQKAKFEDIIKRMDEERRRHTPASSR